MRERTRNLILAGLFAALMAVAGRINIPLPLPGAMVLSPQTMMAALAGIVLGPKWGVASQAVYLALGLAGMPIFTMGGGPGYVFQPSFGFTIGFLLTAWVGGMLTRKPAGPVRCGAAAALAILAGYAVGLPYMAFILNIYLGKGLSAWQLAQLGFLAYLPGECVKVLCAALIAPPIRKAVRR